MWPYILLFAVAASASEITVEVLHNGPLYNSSNIGLVVNCESIGTVTWCVNGDIISINNSELASFRTNKNITILVTFASPKEDRGAHQSLLVLIFDELSEPPEVTCSSSSGHGDTLDSRTIATPVSSAVSIVTLFEYLFLTVPKVDDKELIIHALISGVNGLHLHFGVYNESSTFLNRHDSVRDALHLIWDIYNNSSSLEHSALYKLTFFGVINNQTVSILMFFGNGSTENVSHIFRNNWLYVKVEKQKYESPDSTSEFVKNETTRATERNTSGQQHSIY